MDETVHSHIGKKISLENRIYWDKLVDLNRITDKYKMYIYITYFNVPREKFTMGH
jgi:hypothetical protein